jgi:hypothetical protein
LYADDIDLLPRVLRSSHVAVSRKQEVQLSDGNIIHVLTDEYESLHDELKQITLANSLINIQEKRIINFFVVDLHLKLLNGYVKKVMRDRRTSSMDLEYLFEYSARFVSASTVRHVGFLLPHQAENLFVLGGKALKVSVDKFNAKWMRTDGLKKKKTQQRFIQFEFHVRLLKFVIDVSFFSRY